MRESEPVALLREVEGVEIPAGTRSMLPAGAHVLVTQTLGGNYTVMTVDGALYRVDKKDADALGHEVQAADPRLATPDPGRHARPRQISRRVMASRSGCGRIRRRSYVVRRSFDLAAPSGARCLTQPTQAASHS